MIIVNTDKRLTKRLEEPNGIKYIKLFGSTFAEYDGFYKYANKIAHYEDLEEAGLLIELPCKVGDTVYFPLKNKHNSAIIDCIQIEKYGVFVYWKQYETGVDVTELWDEGSFEISAIGKTVFLTKAEAEAKLIELKGGKND